MSLRSPVENMDKKGLASIIAAYEALSSSKSGRDFSWLDEVKEKAARRWSSEGLPTRQSERWKYTSLAMLNEAQVTLPELSDSGTTLSHFDSVAVSAEIVLVNGVFSPTASRISGLEGVKVTLLSELIAKSQNGGLSAEQSEVVAKFRSFIEANDEKVESVFALMNSSFMRDAVLIQVESGKVIKEPVLIRHLTNGSAKDDPVLPLSCSRVLVSLGRGAELALIEVYSSETSAKWFVNAVTDIKLEEAARLSYCRLQTENENSLHIGSTRIHLKRNSFSESAQFTFGGRLSREDLLVRLDAEGAEASLNGLYFAKGQQHVDNYTLVDHAVPNTTSQQVYKGILDGESRAVFNGHVRIHRDAQKSNASQINKNLMLSRKAEVDTRPELEIDADDVKASHGATIGQIDPEHIYYLQSRGISKAESIKMLSRGFAQEVAFEIKNEAIRTFMRRIVSDRLNQMEVGHE